MTAHKDKPKHGARSSAGTDTGADSDTGERIRLEQPRFGGVALVCRECEKRGDGPRSLQSSSVRKRFKYELHHAPVRLRVLQSSCLGLCPKKAIAAVLVVADAGAPPRAAAIRDELEAEAVARAFARLLEAG